jgi:hypothetical protein
MITLETLKKFCGEWPEWITEPWTWEKHSYATDGFMVLRVPSDMLFTGKITNPSPAMKLHWEILDGRTYFRLRRERFEAVREKHLCGECSPDAPPGIPCRQSGDADYHCWKCDGRGYVKSGNLYNTAQCPHCAGTRWDNGAVWCLRKTHPEGHGYHVNPKILQKLMETFGDLEFTEPIKDTHHNYPPIGFRFDGGDGLLMPMRPNSERVVVNI